MQLGGAGYLSPDTELSQPSGLKDDDDAQEQTSGTPKTRSGIISVHVRRCLQMLTFQCRIVEMKAGCCHRCCEAWSKENQGDWRHEKSTSSHVLHPVFFLLAAAK